jgi:hypothetical protein
VAAEGLGDLIEAFVVSGIEDRGAPVAAIKALKTVQDILSVVRRASGIGSGR